MIKQEPVGPVPCARLSASRVQTVKRAGGVWRPRQRLWELSWNAVRTLGLHGRVVE